MFQGKCILNLVTGSHGVKYRLYMNFPTETNKVIVIWKKRASVLVILEMVSGGASIVAGLLSDE